MLNSYHFILLLTSRAYGLQNRVCYTGVQRDLLSPNDRADEGHGNWIIIDDVDPDFVSLTSIPGQRDDHIDQSIICEIDRIRRRVAYAGNDSFLVFRIDRTIQRTLLGRILHGAEG